MKNICVLLVTLVASIPVVAQQTVTFQAEDGGKVCADLYGQGTRGVVLAHGGRFNKESWKDQAQILVSKGFRVLAIDFRGFGCSSGPGQADFDTAPFYNDVLAGVQYLKASGARTVSVVGGSFGSSAAGDASIKAPEHTIDRIVFLGGSPNLPASGLKSRSLFIVAKDDSNGAGPRLPGIRTQYEIAPQPKKTGNPRRLSPRSVSVSNRPKHPRHAGDPAISIPALNKARFQNSGCPTSQLERRHSSIRKPGQRHHRDVILLSERHRRFRSLCRIHL